jgi:NEDD8-activating enzyme E1 regulatory subunit
MYISSFVLSMIGRRQYVLFVHTRTVVRAHAHLQHDRLLPQTAAEKEEFKSVLNAQKRTSDEENFEEAVAQAYRAWTPTTVPPYLAELFTDVTVPSTPFGHLVSALRLFSERPPYALPLSATLPDMKSDTEGYVRLQNLYRTQAAAEREQFRSLLQVPIESELVDLFVKNAHGVQLLKGERYGALDAAPERLGELNTPRHPYTAAETT